MTLPTVRKEEMLSIEEEFFAKAIRHIEEDYFMMTEEKYLIFLHIYIEAVTDTIDLYTKSSKDIEEHPIEKEFLLHMYAKGATDFLKLIYNKMIYIENYAVLEDEKKLLFNMYIDGIEDTTYAYTKGISMTEITRITKDINSFLAEAEGKYPEEIWEEIRKRIGLI